MYIIISGEARFEHGHQWESCDPFEVEEARAKNRERKRKLKSGDSFGEEIILGLEENYHYTVVSITSMSKYAISVASFTQAFRHMPDVIHKMHENFTQNASPDHAWKKRREGRPCISEGRTGSAFRDVVLDTLQDITKTCTTVDSKIQALEGAFVEHYSHLSHVLVGSSAGIPPQQATDEEQGGVVLL